MRWTVRARSSVAFGTTFRKRPVSPGMIATIASAIRCGSMRLPNHHVPLICSLAPPPPIYKRNYLKRGNKNNLEDASIGFDVVTEQVWPDEATFHAWLKRLHEPGTAEKVDADERRFLDKARYWAYVIDEHQASN
jgi:EthD domain